ncbi:hypothetical protein ACOMHN_065856 [Nucella lapillus]
MLTFLQLVLAVAILCCCQSSLAFYRRPFRNSGRMPPCSESSRPCRLQAVLVGVDSRSDPPGELRRLIHNHLCSCPPSAPCSTDWSPSNNKMISRELRTNGNINMTFSMMFCTPVHLDQNQRGWCQPGQVALRLMGMSSVPTELDFVSCRCADSRPLVLHRRYIGMDFKQYDDYVCSNHKRRCNVEWNPDTCLIHTPANRTDGFPCKCPYGTVCRSTSDIPFNKDFRCLSI